MSMPLRTRLYAAVVARANTSIEQVSPEQIPELRERRIKWRLSRVGRWVFGRAHEGAEITERMEQIGDVELRLRIYRPKDPAGTSLPVVVNFHGGGWVLGDSEQSDWLCTTLSAEAGVCVVSVDYRLAPENPFPAAADDCVAATRWVAAHAEELGIDADRLAVMGDSAGGNLAAVVALVARDRGEPAVRCQVLIYPVVELEETFDSERRLANGPGLTSAGMTAFKHHYMGTHDLADPMASPLRWGDLAGVAPALIQTAENDPLLDNGIHYADALRAAGVPVRYTCYRGAIHGYVSTPGACPSARQAVDEIVDELGAALSR